MANPTGQVLMEFVSFQDDGDAYYWPTDTTKTADTIYTGELMGMLFSNGYCNHFDDSAVMVFLGNKIGDTSRFATDTPQAGFKQFIRNSRFVTMPVIGGSGTPAIPGNIGDPAYAANSGQ